MLFAILLATLGADCTFLLTALIQDTFDFVSLPLYTTVTCATAVSGVERKRTPLQAPKMVPLLPAAAPAQQAFPIMLILGDIYVPVIALLDLASFLTVLLVALNLLGLLYGVFLPSRWTFFAGVFTFIILLVYPDLVLPLMDTVYILTGSFSAYLLVELCILFVFYEIDADDDQEFYQSGGAYRTFLTHRLYHMATSPVSAVRRVCFLHFFFPDFKHYIIAGVVAVLFRLLFL